MRKVDTAYHPESLMRTFLLVISLGPLRSHCTARLQPPHVAAFGTIGARWVGRVRGVSGLQGWANHLIRAVTSRL